MEKAVLILDMPKSCADCQMCNMNLIDMSKGEYCQMNKSVDMTWEQAKSGKPEWCPLRELAMENDVSNKSRRNDFYKFN